MTIGVYGLVGMIVKIDDLGLYLTTVPSVITTISADKIKSVLTAPFIFSFSKVAKSNSSRLVQLLQLL
jgi:predicted DNA repair protein MutK